MIRTVMVVSFSYRICMPGLMVESGLETVGFVETSELTLFEGDVLTDLVVSCQMYASSIGGTSTVEQAVINSPTNPMNSVFFKSF